MMKNIEKEFPLHYAVFNNNSEELKNLLKKGEHDKEKLDARGRTPLMLAVKLSYGQCVRHLLANKCNANFESNGWSVVQEAVCAGDEQILTDVLEVRDLQRHIQRVTHVPKLLEHLLDAPDFYVEMKWEFTSWLPLMSRFCPSDTYKVYKRGSNVRIDTTLLGFDNATWQRGNRSYIFKGAKDSATMIEIDHDTHEVLVEELHSNIGDIEGIPIPLGSARARLNAPVISNNIDMDRISFERNKSGIWGWRSEKSESVNGYNCKVYGASNVEFITRTRIEHLSEEQLRNRNSRTPLHNFLGIAEDEYVNSSELSSSKEKLCTPTTETRNGADIASSSSSLSSNKTVTAEEYFSGEDLNEKDVGRPQKVSTKIQRFKANLWLSEEFPIKLQEQVLPILDLMSTMASPHVSKLKDFITMQLPTGFPVKVEIPLFHVLNACVTFGNVFGTNQLVDMVQTIQEENNRLTCIIDDQCFDIPVHYVNRDHDPRRQITLEDEDDLLQFAIEQSLMESKTIKSDKVDIWEALSLPARENSNSNPSLEEENQLQRVLQESLSQLTGTRNELPQSTTSGIDTLLDQNHHKSVNVSKIDPDLAIALQLSEQDQRNYELSIQQEEELMEKVLKLSLEEK